MTRPEQLDDAANATFYDRDASTYDATRFDDVHGMRESRRLRELLIKRMRHDNSLRVLEVGCGTGRATQWLAPMSSQLTLVDVAPTMLDAASRRALDANPDVELTNCRASAFKLPFPPGVFDVVVSINMLGHLSDLDAVIGQLAGTLRVGGTMIVSTPSLYSVYLPAGLVVNRRRVAIGQHVYSKWPSRADVSTALERSCMSIDAIDAAVHVPRAVRRAPLIPRILSGADYLAARGGAAARLAPWLLWTATKRASPCA